MQNKISKDYYSNKFTTLKSDKSDPKRFSALVNKSQLKMLKEFINNNTITISKPYEEKHIEQPEVKDLEIENNKISEKDKNVSNSKKMISSVLNDDQLDCTLNVIKIKNKNESSKKEALLMLDEDKINSKLKKLVIKFYQKKASKQKPKKK